MPHINHRRGDDRRRTKGNYGSADPFSMQRDWKRQAWRRFRAASHMAVRELTRTDAWDERLPPALYEVSDRWAYD